MARERAAVAGGAAMGGRAAAARSDLRGAAAACVWRKKMGSPGLRRMEMREIRRNWEMGVGEPGVCVQIWEEDGAWRRSSGEICVRVRNWD
ncbi:hypothetical protein MRB53_010098 [Persea americana]|uniref:Uncharacterized protein n=1 Tax=Persea americana TaxID=3435 RepID=A0ACC2LQS1_PERAE|nr:hypothetical protein MRB53_010098 [Persea americana]